MSSRANPFFMHPRFWRQWQLDMLRDHYAELNTRALAGVLGRSVGQVHRKAQVLGLAKSRELIAAEARWNQRHLNTGNKGAFKKGNRPWNADIKGSTGHHPNTVANQFKPGQLSGRAAKLVAPVGSYRRRAAASAEGQLMRLAAAAFALGAAPRPVAHCARPERDGAWKPRRSAEGRSRQQAAFLRPRRSWPGEWRIQDPQGEEARLADPRFPHPGRLVGARGNAPTRHCDLDQERSMSLPSSASTALVFQSTTFDIVAHDGQPWLRCPQIGDALGYAKRGGVAIDAIYKRNAGEFTASMTAVVKLPTAGGMQDARIFSLRGAHLLGMFARTPKAAEFRRWVLDVLEREQQASGTLVPGRTLAGTQWLARFGRDGAMTLHPLNEGGRMLTTWPEIIDRLREGRIEPEHLPELREAAAFAAFTDAAHLAKGHGAQVAKAIREAREQLSMADLYEIATAAAMELWALAAKDKRGANAKAGAVVTAIKEK